MTASDARLGRVVAPRRGRPPKPLDPDASCAARLGAELQKSRLAQNLTLQALSDRIGYSLQHVSQVEHGRGTANEAFLRVCEAELDTHGALLRLLPDVILEHARVRSARAAARRSAGIHRKPEDHMDAISRRGLAGAGAAAVLGLPGVPGAAGDVDPLLPEHSECLLAILGAHDAAHGPHQMLDIARRELRLIGEHRRVTRGELRIALMRIEARWTVYAAWLCQDTGDRRSPTALLQRALHLAREADQPDLIAWTRARQAQWSDPPRAIRLAETGLRTPRAGAHTRALCALRAAHAHALLADHQATKRLLGKARRLAAQHSAPPPLASSAPLAEHIVPCWQARCWAALNPPTGVTLYDEVLHTWPGGRTRDGGLYLARLAQACAQAGDLDRARTEGRKALAIARTTDSQVTARELTTLTTALRTDNNEHT